ncbi:DUF2254 domain-containing protein [Pedobacter changchengzhani]|uniref:DUF2254 domain-containing protein n=1 Tax=Pedobacter changchengzhani TaxID=2529274 RepID=A0A4R5MNH7_9SPHI|nr:DUF2254 domain-containing protein [Pedobacter changchengzhani]TDG37314.1 DUF2254 domain-containing protein [Pedobacter changchengzhani]
MKTNLTKWLRITYNKITNSIAFYPALIAVGFLILSWCMLELDFSSWGKQIKSGMSWLSLKDASTARSIISTVAGAIISLTVFSFSMVMIVLNQAASQMSNRVLTSMIENRFQQLVLGFYIGTIVYALFLLSTIRDIDSGVYIPALSIYLLILLTIIDIFLFIYFLDYVTQTVKYETVINRVKKQTLETMHKRFAEETDEKSNWDHLDFIEVNAPESNYFQGMNTHKLLKTASDKNFYITFLHKQSSFLIKGTPFFRIYSNEKFDNDFVEVVLSTIDFYGGQPIDINADYGFNQLAEIAIKALSPGINDPGTAVISLHALSSLFSFRIYQNLPKIIVDEAEVARIYKPTSCFTELFEKCFYPIWNYGKNDQYIRAELLNIIKQLKLVDCKNRYTDLFNSFVDKVESVKVE